MNVTRSVETTTVPCESSRAQDQFLAHLEFVERLARYTCRRHRGGPDEMEEFASFTKLKLIENDYAILRKFEGRSRLATYLATVLKRLHLDHRNQVSGKWRPSAEARRLGRVAETMERLIVRDRHTVDEACEILQTTIGGDASIEELRVLASRVSRAPRRQQVDETALDSLWSDDGRPDRDLMETERAGLARTVRQKLERAIAHLPAEDRFLVELRIVDGRRVSEIARVLGTPAKQLYGRFDAIYRDLRRRLEAEGVDGAKAAQVLAAPAAGSSSLVPKWGM